MNPSPLPRLIDLGLPLGPEHECPYLPDRMTRERAFMASDLPPGIYERLLEFGWRRTGNVIYKPFCEGCAECVPQRIPTFKFVPSRWERRVLARNRDVRMTEGPLQPDRGRFDLFVRYQQSRHTGDMCTEWHEFAESLYASPLDTRELAFFVGERLVVAAIVDVEPKALSAVYTYFDPEESRRGLGTFAILKSVEYARLRGIEHYYLGYYIAGCRRMNYKARFQPSEYGNMLGGWQRMERPDNPTPLEQC
jgi:arginyl-tRNA--protein-N-Asp/Glu arginylyltransferase